MSNWVVPIVTVRPPYPRWWLPVDPGYVHPGRWYWGIRPGDTLWKIAAHLDTTVEYLRALNPGFDPQNLPIGGRLWLS